LRYSKFILFSLSTTKWIHFNWGDAGIKTLFAKVSNMLNEGGYFILEPQPWDTYKSKASLTPAIRENYKNIQLKPEQFSEYLVRELKLTLVKSVDVPADVVTAKGFARPMLVFKK
jgi:7SK snRNA methylphosphate capping enzyme